MWDTNDKVGNICSVNWPFLDFCKEWPVEGRSMQWPMLYLSFHMKRLYSWTMMLRRHSGFFEDVLKPKISAKGSNELDMGKSMSIMT